MATALVPPPPPIADSTSLIPKKAPRARPLFDPPIVQRAIGDSFRKLHPRPMMKNPVMFVVEVGAAMTTHSRGARSRDPRRAIVGFTFQITLWLWFTVLFANFAEAMAEGRGKAQADTLRKTKTETTARRIVNGRQEIVAATQLRSGDIVRVEIGETIPGDGDVIEGIATRGRIRHHRRERAGDPRIRRRPQRCDWRHQGALGLDQGQDHIEPRRDVSRPHDRAGGRRGAAEDAE